MIEEKAQDWKEKRIAEYAKLEKEITTDMQDMGDDQGLNGLIAKRERLTEIIKISQKVYLGHIEEAQQRQAVLKAELADGWDIEDKTFNCPAGTATLRTTRTVKVESKSKLIVVLATINKLSDYIKSFETPKLRKLKEAGLLDDEIASWNEKRNVSIRVMEAGEIR